MLHCTDDKGIIDTLLMTKKILPQPGQLNVPKVVVSMSPVGAIGDPLLLSSRLVFHSLEEVGRPVLSVTLSLCPGLTLNLKAEIKTQNGWNYFRDRKKIIPAPLSFSQTPPPGHAHSPAAAGPV